MPKTKLKQEVTAIQTSAGMGTRSRPLSLYSPTSMIPKGLMRIMGIPIAEIQLESFKYSGINNAYIITQFLENREHLSNRFGDGSRRGMRLIYSDPSDDKNNNGSGDAILTNLERKTLTGTSIWLPNDNLFEYNPDEVLELHYNSDAVISIMAVMMRPRRTINTYGLISVDKDNRVLGLEEKPKTIEDVLKTLGLEDESRVDEMRVPVNTAGYVLNNDMLADLIKQDWLSEARRSPQGFDMAGGLIKKLIEHDYPVQIIPINKWGDFGSTDFFLDTFPDVLAGTFPSVYMILRKKGYEQLEGNVWVHPDALKSRYDGLTLKQRIQRDKLRIGPNVFIGRDVTLGNGSSVSHSNLEKYSYLGDNVSMNGVYVSPYCQIRSHSELKGCALGLGANVESSKEQPTRINGRTVLGPEITVPEGTRLRGVKIFPGYQFSGSGEEHYNKELHADPKRIFEIVGRYSS